MKLVSAYANVTIESGLTKEQFTSAQKHCPSSLVLRDENKKAIFALETGTPGVITGAGVKFDNMTGTGALYISIADKDMPADMEKRTAYLHDNYGRIAYLVKKIEDQVTAALAANASEIQTVADAIVVG